MADAFSTVRVKAAKAAKKSAPDQTEQLRKLDIRQRRVLTLFKTDAQITTKQIAGHLGIHRRTALNLCNAWSTDWFNDPRKEADILRKVITKRLADLESKSANFISTPIDISAHPPKTDNQGGTI